MANTTLTHQMVARASAEIFEEEAPFVGNINMARKDEFDQNVNGYNKGDTVRVKIPPVSKVFTTSVFADGGAAADSAEQFVNLTLNIQRHVALQFSAKEKLTDLSEFRERILRPQIRMLSSVVEADMMTLAYAGTCNAVGTPGTIPTTMKTYAQARAKMENFLAPPVDRTWLYSSDANTELVDASKVLFNPTKQIEKGFLRGTIGEAQNAMVYEHQSIPVHVNGTQASWTINGAGQTGSTLNIGGLTAANTIKKGTIFTAGVNAVHPLTGNAYSTLQQFVVTADFTAAGTTGSISIFPAIAPVAPNKTVSASPTNGATCVMFGAVSTSYRQNLMFQKDAYTVAFAPLPVIASCEGYTATLPNGFSVRVMTFGDGNNDVERTRIDVLAGFAAVRGQHACRITE